MNTESIGTTLELNAIWDSFRLQMLMSLLLSHMYACISYAYLDPPGVHFFCRLLKKLYVVSFAPKRAFFFEKCCFKILPTRGRQMSLFGRGMSPLGRAMSPFRLHPGFAKQQNMQKCAEAKTCVVCTKRSLWPKQHKKGIPTRAQVWHP